MKLYDLKTENICPIGQTNMFLSLGAIKEPVRVIA